MENENSRIRRDILMDALGAVTLNEGVYGSPESNLETIASLWHAIGFTVNGRQPTSKEVALAMVLLKVAREMGGRSKRDNFVDIAGYAAIGAEVADESHG